MQNKLQELTDRIYQEGVQKARQEADAIILKAKQEADAILKQASSDAKKIEQEALNKASETARNIESEMKLAASQSLSALKQQITDTVTLKSIQPAVNDLFSNPDFVAGLIGKLVKEWASSGRPEMDLLIAESDIKEMEIRLKNSLANELNKGVTILPSNQIKSGFKIEPHGENYVISFTEMDFTHFFRTYLRPKTNQLLFDQQ